MVGTIANTMMNPDAVLISREELERCMPKDDFGVYHKKTTEKKNEETNPQTQQTQLEKDFQKARETEIKARASQTANTVAATIESKKIDDAINALNIAQTNYQEQKDREEKNKKFLLIGLGCAIFGVTAYFFTRK